MPSTFLYDTDDGQSEAGTEWTVIVTIHHSDGKAVQRRHVKTVNNSRAMRFTKPCLEQT